jgi:hypothetical protein
MLACPPDRLRVGMVRAEGLEPPHLAILEPKSSASTSSATRARPLKVAAYSKDGRLGNPRQGRSLSRMETQMQQPPPFPDDPGQPSEPVEPQPTPPERPANPIEPQPSQPGQPTPAPPETPPQGPDIDVPAPATPGTEPPSTPIAPVG